MVLAGYTGRRFMCTVSEWDDMRWAELPESTETSHDTNADDQTDLCSMPFGAVQAGTMVH